MNSSLNGTKVGASTLAACGYAPVQWKIALGWMHDANMAAGSHGLLTPVATRKITEYHLDRYFISPLIGTFDDRSDKSEEDRHRQWADATPRAFDARALPGGYPNLLAAGEPERVMKSYAPNAERLVEAKRHYDPDNVFRSAIPLPTKVNRPTSPAPRFTGGSENAL
jgi:hypothetical protein